MDKIKKVKKKPSYERLSGEELEKRFNLKTLTWYVVEVSFFPGNSVHRVVCKYKHSGSVELFGSYENIEYKHISDLHYFKVIKPLDLMNERSDYYLVDESNTK
ncbi:hypothetical protein ACK8P5_26170 (plasmid) [Paenibacillus sp. EC2-1]|uniref:hypothetical protein n=1 Tax=Paenibacillus sp. EC2-1 TaxID=3388665 RepID=UPI003BEF44CC